MISDLDPTFPSGTKQRNQAGVHIRDMKQDVYDSFKNLSGAVTATHTELNYIDGASTGFQSLYITDLYSSNDYYIDGAGSGEQNYPKPNIMMLKFHITNNQADPDIRWYNNTVVGIYDLFDAHGNTISAGQIKTGKIYKLVLVGSDYWITNL